MDMDVEGTLLKNLVVHIQVINSLVAAAKGLKEPEHSQKLAEAGRFECHALKDVLRDDGLWDRLRRQLEDPQLRPIALPLARPKAFELKWLLRDPVLTDLLVALGYEPPKAARELANEIARSLTQVTAAARRGKALPTFDQAEAALKQFRDAVCNLTDSTQDAQQRQERITSGRAMLVGLLLAAVVTPELQDVVRHVAPHAFQFLQAVVDRAGDALGALSLSAVVGATRIASDAVADFAPRRPTELIRGSAADDPSRAEPDSRHQDFNDRFQEGIARQQPEPEQSPEPGRAGIEARRLFSTPLDDAKPYPRDATAATEGDKTIRRSVRGDDDRSAG